MWARRWTARTRAGLLATGALSATPLLRCDDQLFSAKVLHREDVGSTRWLRLQKIYYQDQRGSKRQWDVASRTTKKDAESVAGVDAVAILALLRRASAPEATELLLVRQFRPPVGRVTIELPAGLVDKGETAEVAALRELKEETGYVGTVSRCSNALAMCPGLCDESVKLVMVDVDLDTTENQRPQQALEETEFISVTRVNFRHLGEELEKMEAEGAIPIMGLWMLALGAQLVLSNS